MAHIVATNSMVCSDHLIFLMTSLDIQRCSHGVQRFIQLCQEEKLEKLYALLKANCKYKIIEAIEGEVSEIKKECYVNAICIKEEQKRNKIL